MGFGGIDADVEETRDIFVAFAFGEELQDFTFTGSDAGARGFGVSGGIEGGLGGFGGGGDAGGKIGSVLAKGLDGFEENAIGVIFEDVTACAGFDDLLNEVVGLMHG